MPAATVDMSGNRPSTREHHRPPPPLPFDVLLEVAARTDPATLVCFAAACKDLYRHIADGAFHRRLRLRHAGRFVPSLLHGHLLGNWDTDLRLVDTTTAEAATRTFSPGGGGGASASYMLPIAARDGLALIRLSDDRLRVFSPATGRSHTLPPRSTHDGGQYVLLVGDGVGGIVGRPFQVLNVKTVLTKTYGLQIQIFSSERGTWGPSTEVPTPVTQRTHWLQQLVKPLVVGDTVNWLYKSNNLHYIFTLHVGKAQVTLTKLPTSFDLACTIPFAMPRAQILLATASTSRNLMVLVANDDNISAWVQSDHTVRWKEQPQVIIEHEAFRRFAKPSQTIESRLGSFRLKWFGERSGIVIIGVPSLGCLFWLDLQTKEIVRWFPYSSATAFGLICPYEMDLSSWVPTLRKTF
ncbi:hypothetical protein ACP70R_020603 [Stipagrostis hirtigluma subsp. patula]